MALIEEPSGDAKRHLTLERLEAGFAGLRAPQTERGGLTAIARRLADGTRELPATAELDVDEGLVGDAWSRRPPRDPDAQLTVMRQDIALLMANGQPLTLFGDNLFVDFDISDTHLPAGTRLRLGECVVEVTPEPHTGCAKFKTRFGFDALRFTAQKHMRPHNARGVHWRVVDGGTIRVGDSIEVLSRPT